MIPSIHCLAEETPVLSMIPGIPRLAEEKTKPIKLSNDMETLAT
jgi:hypothetical protein